MKTLISTLALLAVLILPACGGNQDRAIQSAVTKLFVGVDQRDWPAVQSLFADEVLLDYTSMAGGEPARLKPSEIVGSWSGFLPGFESTHHQIGNFQVQTTDTGARLTCYGTATHHIAAAVGGEVWTVVGTYEFDLVNKAGWKVTMMKFNLKYQDGNKNLPALAGERMQAKANQ